MLGSRKAWARLASSYGMTAVLLILCLYYSWATLQVQLPAGATAAEEVASRMGGESLAWKGRPAEVLIVTGEGADGEVFAARLGELLRAKGAGRVEAVAGGPPEVRQALEAWTKGGAAPDVIAASAAAAPWARPMVAGMPSLSRTAVISPAGYTWPTFLTRDNLLNVANQIAVIALIAVGMTLVILTGGIDLSVGSLVALAAVITALLIRAPGGGVGAGTPAMVLASLAGIASCAAVGAFSGLMITAFRIPPFIVTLAMMQVASGLAYIASEGQSIYEIPDSFTWLGREASFLFIPNAVLLLVAVYSIAHVLLACTRFGRYVYAVGGNAEAARLSGVRVKLVLVQVYMLSGAMAGLGGVVLASQLKSGSPQYGAAYELHVIAAVVVGGASLAGGSGKVLGTLIGAFIIAVIGNGMNLTGVAPYRQKVVLGLVILGAVFLDNARKRRWIGSRWIRRRGAQADDDDRMGGPESPAPAASSAPSRSAAAAEAEDPRTPGAM